MVRCSGIFFGLIREKSGSVVAPGIAHGLLDAVAESFAILLGFTL
jgi:membrane protease YdiL (CAAX protease family)